MSAAQITAIVRQQQRPQIRNATFIQPQTGERVRKWSTHRNVDGQNDGSGRSHSNSYEDEWAPLLPRASPPSAERRLIQVSQRWGKCKQWATGARDFVVSDTGKGVLKCSLAYLIGSLATFVPALNVLLGKGNSKHLVATITVYFHPARSLGSMLDAMILAISAFLYTAFVSITSMTVSVFFTDTLGMMALGHVIVLIVFVGGGLGFVGWVKLKLGDPLVNIASSLTSLSLITILTKEGAVQSGDYSFQQIAQILKMLVAGVIATFLVSVLIFPISARKTLKQSMIDVTDSLADMLGLITSSFLSGDEKELEDESFVSANNRHKKTFAKLGQQLKEAKYEHYFLGTERQAIVEEKLVHCVQRLKQSVGGLRSASAMQFSILKQPSTLSRPSTTRAMSSYRSMTGISSSRTPFDMALMADRLSRTLPAIEEMRNKGSESWGPKKESKPGSRDPFRSLSQIFELFISHLGPSMKSLAFTLKEILHDLPYDPEANYAISVDPKFRVSLERALTMYKKAREEALKAVYDQKDIDRNRPVEVQADWEEAAASCGHFSFSLLEVAEQMNDYLIILDELQLEVEEMPSGRTWSWMKFWKTSQNRHRLTNIDPDMLALVEQADDLNLQFKLPSPESSKLKKKDEEGGQRQSHVKELFMRQLYKDLAFLRLDSTKFAIKVGFGAALYALPAFIPATRPIYSHWRGEWGLLSYMLVCSMTVGASNTTGYSRFLGTSLGAILAIAAWTASGDSAVLLAFYGFLMAYWTAYIIVGRGKGPMGRFIMLTYNLSALYAYSLSIADEDNNGDEEDKSKRPLILEIAMHRVVAVLSGCIWGLIITRMVWPINARHKLKDGLSLLWLRMGLIWKRDPLAVFVDGESPNLYMDLREELSLSRYLAYLQSLVEAAKSEIEFSGPFPDMVFKDILEGTSRMLDAFHTMNVVILKDLQASPGEEILLRETRAQRGELCRRISHLFAVLSSCMKLGFPIASDMAALPSVEHTRDRLLGRVFELRRAVRNGELDTSSSGHRQEQQQTSHEDGDDDDNDINKADNVDDSPNANSVQITDEDFGLLYTYALVTGQLGLEILKVLAKVEDLFGVMDEEVLRLQ